MWWVVGRQSLKSKTVIGLLFSAKWSLPCRMFIPVLVEASWTLPLEITTLASIPWILSRVAASRHVAPPSTCKSPSPHDPSSPGQLAAAGQGGASSPLPVWPKLPEDAEGLLALIFTRKFDRDLKICVVSKKGFKFRKGITINYTPVSIL
jgi:hypothetical protein